MPTAIDPAFRNIARNKAGFYIWRIEQLKVVAVPKEQYGNFYKGDSYIVLSIKDVKGAMEMHIHFWLGSESSQDEAGTAAIKSVELDDHLDGAPVQHREVENHESKMFSNYFKSKGLNYMNGGAKSGFNHVEHSFTVRLMRVKGKHHIRATEVANVSWSEMNKGDVFILDVPKNQLMFVWNGEGSTNREKIKGLNYATQLKNGRPKKTNLVVVEDGQENETYMAPLELKVFNEHLPLGEKSAIKSTEAGGEDTKADENTPDKVVKLYVVTDENDTLTVSEVKTGPLKHQDLDPKDAFIISSDQGIWYWKGKESSQKERKGMTLAVGFLNKKGMNLNTQVTTISQWAEPVEFQWLFSNWPQPKSTGKTYNRNKIAKTVQTKFDASTLHSNPQLAAETQMVDDGSGRVAVWRVEGENLVPLQEKYWGEFFGGDSYVIQYTYNSGSEKNIIYFWQGTHSSDLEKGTAALKAVELDDKLGGSAVQVRVVQGKEPPHFMALFDGKMIIFSGGKASGSQDKSDGKDHGDGPGDKYMLHVRGTSQLCLKAVQVPLRAASLNSNDVFVIVTKTNVFIWMGKGCTGDEREMAKKICTRYSRKPDMVFEGQEKKDFWTLLGGQEDYPSEKRLQMSEEVRAPRLFQLSNASGNLKASEIPDFTQEDLVVDDVMLLDAWDTLFLWVGQGANKVERTESPKLVMDYLKSDPAGRDPDATIIQIKQGYEPPNFYGSFGQWDMELWSKGKTYSEMVEDAKNLNEVLPQELTDTSSNGTDFSTVSKYPLEKLQGSADDLPQGVDPTCRELHLETEEFDRLFGMAFAEFQNIPTWKQKQIKQKLKLF
ncbi:villin-1-like isoform X2 [Mizuhopecten yessoensis]|uniref:villin-1-like isoform X2 n=1 Tax=Mizuhopecten yessoensis TaxID=6573 RepID=UPI000B4598B9|nr:villin-1-like isoform X2 [Mizuhopecten yessoensis]